MLHTQKYNLVKFAAEAEEKEKKNPIKGGFGSWLVDMLHPLSHPWSSRRAATAKEVNRATDNKEDTGFTAKHPLTSDVAYTLGGGIGGALLGGVGSAMASRSAFGTDDFMGLSSVTVPASSIGGALLGKLLANINRRGSITDAKENYEENKEKLEEDKVSNPDMNHSYLADALLPLGGPYRRAEINTNKFLKGKRDKREHVADNILTGLASSPASPLQIPAGIIENWAATNKAHGEIKDKNKEKA